MNAVARALWFIETRLADAISFDEIAGAGCVSRFHLSRAFGAATGHSVMGYVRGRRLSVAAHALAGGAADILSVALDAGYGSHEAFTRAFREQFGLTPEAVRRQRHLENIALVEPMDMERTFIDDLEPPRFVDGPALLIAGLSERYTEDTSAGIPAQWQRFVPYIGKVPGQVGQTSYGICRNADGAGSFDYVCGVEVSDFANVPEPLVRLRIPAQRYAVFVHRGHITAIRNTLNTIWNRWLPASGIQVVDAPDFERYDERFDPCTGMGEVEFWLPVQGEVGNPASI